MVNHRLVDIVSKQLVRTGVKLALFWISSSPTMCPKVVWGG